MFLGLMSRAYGEAPSTLAGRRAGPSAIPILGPMGSLSPYLSRMGLRGLAGSAVYTHLLQICDRNFAPRHRICAWLNEYRYQ